MNAPWEKTVRARLFIGCTLYRICTCFQTADWVQGCLTDDGIRLSHFAHCFLFWYSDSKWQSLRYNSAVFFPSSGKNLKFHIIFHIEMAVDQWSVIPSAISHQEFCIRRILMDACTTSILFPTEVIYIYHHNLCKQVLPFFLKVFLLDRAVINMYRFWQ
jgi:hypothetical protein